MVASIGKTASPAQGVGWVFEKDDYYAREGGFYGEGAAEAGGVLEVVGGREERPGRVVGAFGGKLAGH